MELLLAFVLGLIFGVGGMFLLHRQKEQQTREMAREMMLATQGEKMQELEVLALRLKDSVKESFGALSGEALSKSTTEFLKLAEQNLGKQTQTNAEQLDGKKRLIDQTLGDMRQELTKVQDLVKTLERDRVQKFGQLESQLKMSAEQSEKLQLVTQKLSQALSSTKQRGAWGERMAEDVLRLAGFVEGVNYVKQATMLGGESRPDYTFLLPSGLKVHMDVKFPLTNYLHYLETTSETDRQNFKESFLRDVRQRIKEAKDYIDTQTIDNVIVFIPNEQVYNFILSERISLLDEAQKMKVIVTSPLTLYGYLLIIHQAVEHFRLEKTAREVQRLMGDFYKQWQEYLKSMEKMGQKISEAQKEFDYLTTTRQKGLDRSLQKIEQLRQTSDESPLLEGETVSPPRLESGRSADQGLF